MRGTTRKRWARFEVWAVFAAMQLSLKRAWLAAGCLQRCSQHVTVCFWALPWLPGCEAWACVVHGPALVLDCSKRQPATIQTSVMLHPPNPCTHRPPTHLALCRLTGGGGGGCRRLTRGGGTRRGGRVCVQPAAGAQAAPAPGAAHLPGPPAGGSQPGAGAQGAPGGGWGWGLGCWVPPAQPWHALVRMCVVVAV